MLPELNQLICQALSVGRNAAVVHAALALLIFFQLPDGFAANSLSGEIVRVGPGRAFAAPSAAARKAKPGSIIEIDAGDYYGDVALWRQNDLIIRGVGGRVRLHANGRAAEDKAIWVIRGDRVVIENVEFSGAKVRDHNGAGIRAEGADLTLRHCRLHHNEMGLMTLARPDARVLIEDCEIDNNITDTAVNGRLGHNIYIGRIASFALHNSYVHSGSQGHLVKSRAKANFIIGNRLEDPQGSSSYLIDLPNGGQAQITGNHLVQGVNSSNPTAIAFAAEHNRDVKRQRLRVSGNSFESDRVFSVFVRNFSVAEAQLRDNTVPTLSLRLIGPGTSD